MLDVLIALVLVGAGYWLGQRAKRPEKVAVEEREVERLQEDRAAFMQLMGYSAERAYGLEEE